MPQSTLMSWFSKPTPAKEAPASSEEDRQQPSPLQRDESHNVGVNTLIESRTKSGASISAGWKILPPNVEFRACRKEDIKNFKQLNSLLLPIPYGESFYRQILEDEVINNVTLMALWHDDPGSFGKEKGMLVGAIRCRLLAHSQSPDVKTQRDGPMLYLGTLVLLSPYRHHGIAAYMLDTMIKRAVNDYGIASVGAHVWEANDEGLAWYRKRGFREVGREEGYYRRLKPQGAVVMQKDVGVMDLVGR